MTDELVVGDRTMPAARTILGALRDQVNAGVIKERQLRGEVASPEDIHPMIRSLAAVADTCDEYANAFRTISREVGQIAEEELSEAFGAQDEIPTSGIKVNNEDGTRIDVTLQFDSRWEADPDAVMSAVAYQVMREFATEVEGLIDPHSENGEAETALAGLLILAMQRFVETGKYEPQVTKVKQLVAELATGAEGDRIASTVSTTLKRTRRYRGVKIERKQTKETKA